MEKDGKLVYIPNVMAGVTISGINTAACLLLTAVLFLLEKGKGGEDCGACRIRRALPVRLALVWRIVRLLFPKDGLGIFGERIQEKKGGKDRFFGGLGGRPLRKIFGISLVYALFVGTGYRGIDFRMPGGRKARARADQFISRSGAGDQKEILRRNTDRLKGRGFVCFCPLRRTKFCTRQNPAPGKRTFFTAGANFFRFFSCLL